jgi:predicted  nucleic acid-binding Zn-ribbon protein
METIKNFVIKNYKTILSVLIGLFIVYWVMTTLNTSTMSTIDRNKLDSLTNVVNEINKEQDILESKIELIDEEVEKIDDNISRVKTNKVKTGKKYHEEINRVDKYTEPELDSFFSNRYK